MAKGNHRPAYAFGAIAIITLVLIGTGVIDLQTLNFGGSSSGGGGMQTPVITPPSTGSDFTGQLTVTLVQRDALDNAETRTETNVANTYYKSQDEITYNTIGSGTPATLTIDSSQNSIMYIGSAVPSGQAFFVAPSATADRQLNPRIIDFEFKDITKDGQSEWVFKVDLHDMPAPIAGQTASSITIFVNSYDDGATTLNAPANSLSLSDTAGTLTWIRWEQTVGVETADPVYEYEVKFNNTDTTFWDRGLTILDIPNVGAVSLSDFKESQDGSSTIYKHTLGSTLADSNYVTTPQNGNTVHPIPLKLSHDFATAGSAGDTLEIVLTIRSLTSAQGTASVADCVKAGSQTSTDESENPCAT